MKKCRRTADGTTPYSFLMNRNCSDMSVGDISRLVGTVFQNPENQFFTLDVLSDLVFGCENFGIAKAEIERKLDYVVNLLKIKPFLGRKLAELSGGEKQKIAIASALMMESGCLHSLIPVF